MSENKNETEIYSVWQYSDNEGDEEFIAFTGTMEACKAFVSEHEDERSYISYKIEREFVR